jgi:hypothetical protein
MKETINPHIPIDLPRHFHKEKIFMRDQLDTLLLKESSKRHYFDNNPLFTGLKELEFPNDKDKKFTCKFKTGDKAEYQLLDKNLELEDCRNRPLEMNQEYIEDVQQDCGVDNRTPSRCDRFLLIPNDNRVGYDVIKHTAVYLKEIRSDHNAIECVVEFNNNGDIYDNSRLFEQPPPMSRRTSSRRTMGPKRRSSRNSASSNGDSFHSANSSISQSDKRPSRGGTKKRRKTKRKKQTKGRKQRR